MVQWRHAAVKPPGQAKPDGEIVDYVFRRVRDLVHDSKDPKDEIIKKAFWTYTTAEDVLREINGYALRDIPETGLKKGDLVRKVGDLQADGSTSSGCWIYAGVFAKARTSRSAATRRPIRAGSGSTRASAGPGPTTCGSSTTAPPATGTASPIRAPSPSSGGTRRQKRWTGYDVPDVPVLTDGPDTPNGQRAFHLSAEGVGRLFAAVYKDPDPRHTEVPARRRLRAEGRSVAGDVRARREPGRELSAPEGASSNPTLKYPRVKSHQPIGTVDEFPLRPHDVDGRRALVRRLHDAQHPVAERARPGAHDRDPESPRQKLGVKTGDWVKVSSARGELDGEGRRHAAHEAAQGRRPARSRSSGCPTTGASRVSRPGASVNHLTIDAVGPRRRHPGDEGLPRQRREGADAASARPGGEESMSAPAGRRRPDQDDADRRHQLHRLPRLPGRLQAVERPRRRGDRADAQLGFQNPATLSAKTYTLISFHEIGRREKPGGLDYAFMMRRCFHCLEPACVSACPTTALYRQPDGPVTYDADKCIGCRYCMLGVPLGRPDRGVGLARAEDREVHALRRPHAASRCPLARNGDAAHRGGDEALPRDDRHAGLRQGVPGRRAAFRRARRDARARRTKRIADRPDEVRGPHLRREGGRRHDRALPLRRSVREARLPEVRREAVPGVHEARAGARASRRHGGRRAARRDLRVLQRKRAQAVADAARGRRHAAHAHHAEFEPLHEKLLTPFNWLLLALMALLRRRRSSRGSPSASAAARTSPTPIRGASGSSSTSLDRGGGRSFATAGSSTSSSEKTSTGSAARPCSWAC